MRIERALVLGLLIVGVGSAGIITAPGTLQVDPLTYTGTNGSAVKDSAFSVLQTANIVITPGGTFNNFYSGLPRCIDAQNHQCDAAVEYDVRILDASNTTLFYGYQRTGYYFCHDTTCLTDVEVFPQGFYQTLVLTPGNYTAELTIVLQTAIPSTAATNTLTLGLYPVYGALFTSVPEPMTTFLSGSGIALLFAIRNRYRRNRS